MWKTIDQIRRQPKETHGRYAFLGAAVITGLIALVWLVSLPSRFNDATPGPTPAGEEPGTLADLKTQLSDAGTLLDQTYQWFSDSTTTTADTETGVAPNIEEVAVGNTQTEPRASVLIRPTSAKPTITTGADITPNQ